MNDTITDSRLEEMMLGDAGCESSHIDGSACTVEVTHHYRIRCVGVRKLICASSVAYVEDSCSGHFCADCFTPCADCWSVVPV